MPILCSVMKANRRFYFVTDIIDNESIDASRIKREGVLDNRGE